MTDCERLIADLPNFEGHTRGPWVCHEMTREVEVEAPCGRSIWIGNVHSDDQVLADAHLIAAAPTLLAEFRRLDDLEARMTAALRDIEGRAENAGFNPWDVLRDINGIARAAIADTAKEKTL